MQALRIAGVSQMYEIAVDLEFYIFRNSCSKIAMKLYEGVLVS